MLNFEPFNVKKRDNYMIISAKLFLIFILFLAPAVYGQVGEHRWKPLEVNENEKIWYDTSTLDTAKGDNLEVWVLEMHRPPLRFEGIKGDVSRSKTLYTVSLNSVKYGIMKVVYYDMENKEIFSFDYNISKIMESVKYTYPVMEDSFMHKIIREYFKQAGKI